MRICFLEVDTESQWAVASIGPAFLAAFLREHGHDANFVRATVAMDVAGIVECVVAHRPQLVGLKGARFELFLVRWSHAAPPPHPPRWCSTAHRAARPQSRTVFLRRGRLFKLPALAGRGAEPAPYLPAIPRS